MDFTDTVIGGYQIIDTVGAGGMGVVYLAQHQLLGRKAALKVLLPLYSHDPEVVSRFFGEARAATAIKHPGIVRVYDFGFQDDGSAYIAMEFLDGEPLDARLRRLGMLPIGQALRFAGQMASALAAAHGHGIVHRDLKPGNVFIVSDPQVPGGERVKLLDFGIAKFAVRDDPNSNKTREGAVMGSPAYMAPEQCRGLPGVDGRADLYSVGCMIFEMLCGRPPFDGGGHGGMAIMSAQLAETPAAPSSLRAHIPPELDALILALLAKDPAHRYQTAVDLGTALAAVSGEQVSFSWQASHTDEHGAAPWPSGVGVAPTGPSGQPPRPSDPESLRSSRPGISSNEEATHRVRRPSRGSRGRLAVLGLVGIAAAAAALAVALSPNQPEKPVVQSKVAEPKTPTPTPPPPAPSVRQPRKPALTFHQLRDDWPARKEAATEAPVVVAGAALPSFEFSLRSLLFSADFLGDLLSAVQLFVAPPRTVTWRLTSLPSGARVFDGETVIGTTPLLVAFQESPEYVANLALRLEGYDDAPLTLSGSEDYDQTVTLVPKIPIAFESRPPGAAIVDGAGKELGVTPATVSLSRSDGAVALTLRLEGHDDLPISVVPDRARKTRFALVKQRAMVTIHIDSTPPGAQVIKDGAVLGTTPLDDRFLEEKRRIEYTLRLDGHREQRMRVAGNQSAARAVALKLQAPKKKSACPKRRAAGGRPSIFDPYDPCRG